MNSDAEAPACVDLDEYVKELRGDSKNKRYKAGCLTEYLRFLHRERHHKADPRIAARPDLEAYAAHVASQPISGSTKTTKLRLVLSWYRWMEQTGRIEHNPGLGATPAGLLTGE